MKVNFLFTVAMMYVSSHAFSQESASRFTLNVGASSSYYFMGSASELKSHYGIGGRIELMVNDKFIFGYSQHGSISKGGLLKMKVNNEERFSLFEHSTGFGYKIYLSKNLYMIPKGNIGIGVLKAHQQYKSDWEEIKDEFSQVTESKFFVAPEIKFGYGVSKYLSIEPHIAYRGYFGSSIFPEISAKDLNGLSIGLSIVGHIPLSK
ncbi:hypothetical protein CMT55_08495 [Elizabethkingia anophelis]|nr:hypothetical protein [Elizabethkingia anophelis]MDV3970131.1 hypothetical protein [Elizabethkingia anophelis]